MLRKKKTTSNLGLYGARIAMVLFALLFLFPFVWMLATSLKPSNEVFTTGNSFTGSSLELSNYVAAWTQIPFAKILFNSFFVAASGAAISMVVSFLSAYAFGRLRFRFKNRLFALFVATMMLPHEVLVIPLYIAAAKLGLVDSYWALILPFAFGAFGAFLLRQFVLSLPTDFEEAARIDGANQWQILRHVMYPLLKGPVAVVGALVFIDYWNTLLWPLIVVNNPEMATLPVGLQMFSGELGTAWGPLMAAAAMAVLPSIFVVLVLQRQLSQAGIIGGFGGR